MPVGAEWSKIGAEIGRISPLFWPNFERKLAESGKIYLATLASVRSSRPVQAVLVVLLHSTWENREVGGFSLHKTEPI